MNSKWGEARRTQFSYIPGHTSATPTGEGLRSARDISNILSDQRSDIFNSHGLNELFVFFGQFIDHNIVATPVGHERFDIPVPAGDKYFKGKALPFTRSLRGLTGENSNQRPINTLPSAFDLSAVYGANPLRNSELLEKGPLGRPTGKLKTSEGNFMPLNKKDFQNAPDISARYFLAGDHRANEHPVLTALHTIFLREHNRLCDEIRTKIPNLSGLHVYEYARKINIAQFQKVIYEEFYPAIIHRDLPKYTGYRSTVNPTVSDIFAGAAFRVGHTLVGNELKRRDSSGRFLAPISMNELLFRPATTFRSNLDDFVRGAARTRCQEADLKVRDALRNMLFARVAGEDGFDLVALNIQRGRDHALPTFREIQGIFGLPKAASFDQISSNVETANGLQTAYGGNVSSVEAWTGLMAEDKLAGSGMGKTMEAVWRAEFVRLRDGDQFFFLQRQVFPGLLREKMPETFDVLWDTRKKIFRDLIHRNTDIRATELPSGDLFRSF